MIGPTTGIHAYPQSDGPLPGMGRIACMMRGPRSRAGLIAYPVGPPSESPIASTSRPTSRPPSPNDGAAIAALAKIASTPNTSRNVPMISVTMFATVLRIAGAVQNTASFSPGSSVSFQWLLYAAHTSVAPMNAPQNSPARYFGTSPQSVLPMTANPSVTAGFRCAPLNCATANTAIATAMPQPNVMTIQPLFWALEWFSSTAATTPSPSRIRIAVPMTSAPKMLTSPFSSPPRPEPGRRIATLLPAG